jgi:DnaK suppressor protein
MKGDINKIRELLLTQKQEILSKIQKGKEEEELTASNRGDYVDIATNGLAHELSYMFEEREKEKLRLIDETLESIGQGTYGECLECGDEIEFERLLALPFAKLCLDCKSREERRSKIPIG